MSDFAGGTGVNVLVGGSRQGACAHRRRDLCQLAQLLALCPKFSAGLRTLIMLQVKQKWGQLVFWLEIGKLIRSVTHVGFLPFLALPSSSLASIRPGLHQSCGPFMGLLRLRIGEA
eukprot:scaffold274516_cov43-Tisochrysis_lutea.AAC.1